MIRFETPLADCRLEDDVLYLHTSKASRTNDNIIEHYEIISSKVPGKTFWIVDLTICDTFPKVVRDIIATELPKRCKGLALVVQKPCEQMVANYFKVINSKTLPVKICFDTEEAKKWLKELKSL